MSRLQFRRINCYDLAHLADVPPCNCSVAFTAGAKASSVKLYINNEDLILLSCQLDCEKSAKPNSVFSRHLNTSVCGTASSSYAIMDAGLDALYTDSQSSC